MSTTVAAAAVTADSIRSALREHFAGEEWALVWEVANGMGAATRRWADGIAVNLWPSRGHAIHGIEIKIARNDWQRELKKPEKAEEIHRHCDFWWVAAKRGVVEPTELPTGWGLMEYQTEGRRAGKMVVVTQAVRQERGREVPRGFLAALLRAHTREQSAHTQAAIDKIVAERVERMREYERKNADQLRTYHDQRIQKISSLLSDEEVRWMGDESVVRALRFVLKTGLSCEFGGIAGIRDALAGVERKTRDLLDGIERLAPDLLPEPKSDENNVLRLAHKR